MRRTSSSPVTWRAKTSRATRCGAWRPTSRRARAAGRGWPRWRPSRRTVAVLAVVLPVLGLAGWLTGTAPALWLLPSLAFTTGTLALGGVVGVSRAAYALIAVWIAVIVLPSFAVPGRALALSTGALPV